MLSCLICPPQSSRSEHVDVALSRCTSLLDITGLRASPKNWPTFTRQVHNWVRENVHFMKDEVWGMGGTDWGGHERISTLFSEESLFFHVQLHTNKQLAASSKERCLFRLLIKRLAPSSLALKQAEGVRVQEILAFLTGRPSAQRRGFYDINIPDEFDRRIPQKSALPASDYFQRYICKETIKPWCHSSGAGWCVFSLLLLASITEAQLKATNSEVLILASKEDKDK